MPCGTSRAPVLTAQIPQLGSFVLSGGTCPPVYGRLVGRSCAKGQAGCSSRGLEASTPDSRASAARRVRIVGRVARRQRESLSPLTTRCAPEGEDGSVFR